MSKDEKRPNLAFVGGEQFIVGVPARDLTADELDERELKAADLLASGLYVEAKPEKEPKKDK